MEDDLYINYLNYTLDAQDLLKQGFKEEDVEK